MRHVVVLCTHQGERFIEDQLRSILDQTRPVDVIFVHDFASTDRTRALVRRMGSGSRIPIELILHDDAPGAAASFFRAFDHVAGFIRDRDGVFVADQDDVWEQDKVQRIADAMGSLAGPCEGVLVFHDVKVTDDALNVLQETYYSGDPFRIPRDLARDRLLLSNPVIGHTMAVSGSLLKMVILGASRDRYLMHDWALALFASRFGEIRFVPSSLSFYRQHGANVLGARRPRPLKEQVSRTWAYARRVVWQALAFEHDVRRLRSTRRSRFWLDELLAFADRFAPALGFFVLGLCALLRGPTWRRRALGVLVWARMGSQRDVARQSASKGQVAAP